MGLGADPAGPPGAVQRGRDGTRGDDLSSPEPALPPVSGGGPLPGTTGASGSERDSGGPSRATETPPARRHRRARASGAVARPPPASERTAGWSLGIPRGKTSAAGKPSGGLPSRGGGGNGNPGRGVRAGGPRPSLLQSFLGDPPRVPCRAIASTDDADDRPPGPMGATGGAPPPSGPAGHPQDRRAGHASGALGG